MAKEEQALQRGILQYLRLKGIMAWRNQTTGIYDPTRGIWRKSQAPGVADILGVTSTGRFVAVEVKSRTGKVTPEQEKFLKDVADRGGVAILARNLDDVMKYF